MRIYALLVFVLMTTLACEKNENVQLPPPIPYPAFVITMPVNGNMTCDTPSEYLSVLHSDGAILDFAVNNVPNGSQLLVIINRNREMGDVEITGYIADSEFISAYRQGKYNAEDLAAQVESTGTVIDEQSAKLKEKIEQVQSSEAK